MLDDLLDNLPMMVVLHEISDSTVDLVDLVKGSGSFCPVPIWQRKMDNQGAYRTRTPHYTQFSFGEEEQNTVRLLERTLLWRHLFLLDSIGESRTVWECWRILTFVSILCWTYCNTSRFNCLSLLTLNYIFSCIMFRRRLKWSFNRHLLWVPTLWNGRLFKRIGQVPSFCLSKLQAAKEKRKLTIWNPVWRTACG